MRHDSGFKKHRILVDRSNRRAPSAEEVRLLEDARREKKWKRWGPYLAERQWGTVREDYSEGGDTWYYLPHDHARSRAYRWGEDGLLGITDRQCRLCFALSLWNGRDPILKERLFGLTGPEGNHGEDGRGCGASHQTGWTALIAHLFGCRGITPVSPPA